MALAQAKVRVAVGTEETTAETSVRKTKQN
jgi:hypothetical protein